MKNVYDAMQQLAELTTKEVNAGLRHDCNEVRAKYANGSKKAFCTRCTSLGADLFDKGSKRKCLGLWHYKQEPKDHVLHTTP